MVPEAGSHIRAELYVAVPEGCIPESLDRAPPGFAAAVFNSSSAILE
jgi:hypothetical protein